jgi:alkylation response protein AidB-like acyl-CoA dehydrogenase
MDFKLTDEQKVLKKEFEDFFRGEMKNAPPEFERGGLEAMCETDEGWQFHRSVQKKLAQKGWLSRPWPKEYGGQDAPLMEQILFNEVRSYYRAPGVDNWGIGMFAPTLLIAATEEQKKRLLPPMAKAEVHYCQGWSEPNAGSDLAALKTTAIREGDYYVVNGQKVWTTAAHKADHMFMLARTDPKSKRNAGLSVFTLSLDLPGIDIRPIHYMNGAHIYNEIFFTDVKIPAEDRIGEENEGWRISRETMNFERSGIETFSVARRCFEELVDYAKTTKRDSKFLSEDPIVKQKLAKLYIDIEIGRSLAYKIAWLQQKGGLIFAASAASEAKVFGSELMQRIANFSTEIMGLYGQLMNCEWAPIGGSMVNLYQMCTGANIAAGSNEIQRNLIAWGGLGLPRFK